MKIELLLRHVPDVSGLADEAVLGLNLAQLRRGGASGQPNALAEGKAAFVREAHGPHLRGQAQAASKQLPIINQEALQVGIERVVTRNPHRPRIRQIPLRLQIRRQKYGGVGSRKVQAALRGKAQRRVIGFNDMHRGRSRLHKPVGGFLVDGALQYGQRVFGCVRRVRELPRRGVFVQLGVVRDVGQVVRHRNAIVVVAEVAAPVARPDVVGVDAQVNELADFLV